MRFSAWGQVLFSVVKCDGELVCGAQGIADMQSKRSRMFPLQKRLSCTATASLKLLGSDGWGGVKKEGIEKEEELEEGQG